MQILSLGEHNGKGMCRCSGKKDRQGAYKQTKKKCPVTGHTGSVTSVAISPNGMRIVSGSNDKLVKIWSAETGAEVITFGRVRWVFCEGVGLCQRRSDTRVPWQVRTLAGHTGQVSCVTFSPDGKRILSGCWDYLVKIWDVLKIWDAEKGAEVISLVRDRSLRAFLADFAVLAFPSGSYSAGVSSRFHLWSDMR